MNKKIRGTIQFSSKDFAKDFKQTLLGPKLDKKYTGDYGNYFDDLKNYISKKTKKRKKGGRRKSKHNLNMVRKFRRTRKKRSRGTQGGSGVFEECNELKSKINYLKNHKNEFTNNISDARTKYKKLKEELKKAKKSANEYYNTKVKKGGGGYNHDAVSNEYHKLLNKVEEIENAIKILPEEARDKINEIKYLQYSSDNHILNLLENEEDTNIYDDQIKQYENNFKRFGCENVLKKGGRKSCKKRRKSKKRKTRRRKKRTRRRKRKKR